MKFLFLVFVFTVTQSALADMMNLNMGMPTRLEDATPVERYDFDAQFSMARDGESSETLFIPNLRYGLTDTLQLEAVGHQLSGGDENGSGEVELDLLWVITPIEAPTAVALNPIVMLPTGKQSNILATGLKIDVSQTILGTVQDPHLQLHGNISRSSEWTYAVGASHLALEQTALVLDYYGDDEAHWMEFGVHQGLGKEFYLGAGVNRILDTGARATGYMLALEKQF